MMKLLIPLIVLAALAATPLYLDAYGIGVNSDGDAKEFIDAWLQTVIDDGTWLELWKATVGAKTGTDIVPTPPAINSAGNA